MKTPSQSYETSVLFALIVVLAFLLCVVAGIWGHYQWSTKGFYLKDFQRFSEKARLLRKETTRIKGDVDQDDTAEWNIKLVSMELVTAAVEWDTGIQIALAAWDDIMQPDEGHSDIESQKGDKLVRKRRRSHGRYIINLMRKQVIEGVERRKELSIQLHRMHMEVVSRKVDVQASRVNRRLTCGREIRHARNLIPEKYRNSYHSESPSTETVIVMPRPFSTHLCPRGERATSCPLERVHMKRDSRSMYDEEI